MNVVVIVSAFVGVGDVHCSRYGRNCSRTRTVPVVLTNDDGDVERGEDGSASIVHVRLIHVATTDSCSSCLLGGLKSK